MVQYVQNNRGSIFVTISLTRLPRSGSSRDTAATEEVLQSKQCIAKYCHIKHTKAQALGLSIRNESKRLFGSVLLLLSCIISVMDGWWYIGRIYLTYKNVDSLHDSTSSKNDCDPVAKMNSVSTK